MKSVLHIKYCKLTDIQIWITVFFCRAVEYCKTQFSLGNRSLFIPEKLHQFKESEFVHLQFYQTIIIMNTTGLENSLELWSKSARENAFSSREMRCVELFTEPDKKPIFQ
jgi:hypothetical protein